MWRAFIVLRLLGNDVELPLVAGGDKDSLRFCMPFCKVVVVERGRGECGEKERRMWRGRVRVEGG